MNVRRLLVARGVGATTFLVVTVVVFLLAGAIASAFNSPGLASLLRQFSLYPFLTLPTLAAEAILISLDRTRFFALFTIVERLLMFVAATVAILIFYSIGMVLTVIRAVAACRFAEPRRRPRCLRRPGKVIL